MSPSSRRRSASWSSSVKIKRCLVGKQQQLFTIPEKVEAATEPLCVSSNPEPHTSIGSMIHGHRQLDDVIHPLGVLSFLGLLTHNLLLHQKPEGFRRVWPRATIPLLEKENNTKIKEEQQRRGIVNKMRTVPQPCL